MDRQWSRTLKATSSKYTLICIPASEKDMCPLRGWGRPTLQKPNTTSLYYQKSQSNSAHLLVSCINASHCQPIVLRDLACQVLTRFQHVTQKVSCTVFILKRWERQRNRLSPSSSDLSWRME
eukprot:Blabericola_migrator_1__8540@NODE_4460_length_1146_cov_18_493049_g2761_i0_p2_GENE_NODE_4460_length_1146_cov_18_493049_g2761_i0NODE_4460_length_1146_cov_18_493049_g2761_i0_p2_ORF_typecomplete_len122_score10_00Herpes_env/PF01673_18/0_032_NODE_4460_length_1146_cov_18_493049_g2761_i0552917